MLSILTVDVVVNVTKTLAAVYIFLMPGEYFSHLPDNFKILKIGSFHFSKAKN